MFLFLTLTNFFKFSRKTRLKYLIKIFKNFKILLTVKYDNAMQQTLHLKFRLLRTVTDISVSHWWQIMPKARRLIDTNI
jgi:hypothetical protein